MHVTSVSSFYKALPQDLKVSFDIAPWSVKQGFCCADVDPIFDHYFVRMDLTAIILLLYPEPGLPWEWLLAVIIQNWWTVLFDIVTVYFIENNLSFQLARKIELKNLFNTDEW